MAAERVPEPLIKLGGGGINISSTAITWIQCEILERDLMFCWGHGLLYIIWYGQIDKYA